MEVGGVFLNQVTGIIKVLSPIYGPSEHIIYAKRTESSLT